MSAKSEHKPEDQIRRLERRLERERAARRTAESLLEQKSTDLWDANVRLKEELKNREKIIHERTQQAHQASKAKSDFLATMSHEIRTPLVGVIGMSELILDGELEPEQQNYAETIKISSRALLDLISDILDFSKIESGQIELENTAFNLGRLIEEAYLITGRVGIEKGLRLDLELDPDAYVDYLGDAAKIRQILLNLLGNAMKFTNDGSVYVTCKLLGNDDGANGIEVVIQDTGIGISESAQAKLFSAFTQADSTMSRRFGGSGLGLVISRRLAELMGGSITVDSQEGSGSTFTLTMPLPVRDPQEAPALKHDHDDRPVILLQPDAENRALFKLLQRAGVEALTAPTLAQLEKSFNSVIKKHGSPVSIAYIKLPDRFESSDMYRFLRENARHIELLASDRAFSREFRRELGNLEPSVVISEPIRPSRLFDAFAELEVPSNPDSVEEATPRNNRLRILLAEDNPINQQVATATLNHYGHDVTVAENGKAAVDLCSEQSFDLVFMDMQMPIMDGLEATQRIRELPGHTQTLPIIAMTANSSTEHREACLAAGMTSFVAKPVDRHRLEEVLAEATRRKSSAR